MSTRTDPRAMAGFFYIRILICFAVVSAIAVTLLGLCGQILKRSQMLDQTGTLYCINSIEKAKADLETNADTQENLQVGPDYRRIIIRHEGFGMETAQLINQQPDPGKNENHDS